MVHQCEQRSNVDTGDRPTGLRIVWQRRPKICLASANRPLAAVWQSHDDEVAATSRVQRYEFKPSTIKAMQRVGNRHVGDMPVYEWGIMWCLVTPK
jgi:hypothetical protein